MSEADLDQFLRELAERKAARRVECRAERLARQIVKQRARRQAEYAAREPRTCPICKEHEITGRASRLYCSDACRQEAYRRRLSFEEPKKPQ